MSDTQPQEKIAVWLATGLGIGLVSPAPGTVGGLWGVPLAAAVGLLPSGQAQALAVAVVGLVSVGICAAAARGLGGAKDPGAIVLDEIAALPLVFLGIGPLSWATLLAGWLLFRLFDITKPWPIRQFEKLPGGWGIMADDWVAAAMAGVSLHGLLYLDVLMQWNWFAG